jgi:hypothetical protein
MPRPLADRTTSFAVWRELDVPVVARLAVMAVAVGRLAIGTVALVRPRTPLALWVADEDVDRPASRLLARALGGRDVALALGALVASVRGGAIRSWALAGVAADIGDTVATVAAGRGIPSRRRRQVVALAAGAAAVAGAAVAADSWARRSWADSTAGRVLQGQRPG